MSEQQDLFIKELCNKFDEKYKNLVVLFISVSVVFISAALIVGATQLTKTAAMERQIEINTALLKTVSSDYTPTWYMSGMTKMYSLNTEKIVATLAGKNEEVKKIDIEFLEVIEIMQNNFIRMRGGMTQTTRNVKLSGNGGSQ
jgi:uncharacterized membrane protein